MKTRVSILTSFLEIFLVLLISYTCTAFGATPVAQAIKELDLKGPTVNKDARLEHAGEYLKLVHHEDATPVEKLNAIQACILYLHSARSTIPAEAWRQKADEAFALYRQELVGTDPTAERKLIGAYHRRVLTVDVRDHKDRFDEYMGIINENESVLNSDPEDPLADFYRGELAKNAGNPELAMEFTEKYLAASKKPNKRAFMDMAAMRNAQSRSADAFEELAATLTRFENSPDVTSGTAKPFPGIVKRGEVDEMRVIDLIPYYGHDAPLTGRILLEVARRRYQAADMDSALKFAKMCYDVSPIEDLAPAMELVANYLTPASLDPSMAIEFMEFQLQGAAGTGKNHLSNIALPLSETVAAELQAHVTAMVPATDSIYKTLRNRGDGYLALGRPKDALRSFKSACDAASIEDMKEAGTLIPRALKALDGSVVRVGRFLLYQEHGPDGIDGKPGTADDLTDPLAGEQLPPLPDEVRVALERMVASSEQTVAGYRVRGTAYLALGEYEKGFEQLRGAIIAGTQYDEAEGIEGIARAIKAHDGHLKRAKEYLLFHRYGGNGPDGIVGTSDDIEDPLPAYLKEIKKPAVASAH